MKPCYCIGLHISYVRASQLSCAKAPFMSYCEREKVLHEMETLGTSDGWLPCPPLLGVLKLYVGELLAIFANRRQLVHTCWMQTNTVGRGNFCRFVAWHKL